jgi:hypothetical protein
MRLIRASALLLITATALSGCGGEEDPSTGAETFEAAEAATLEGTEVDLMLPSGQFVLTVTEPREEVAADETADGESRTAPDGQAFVGLAWRWEGMAGPVLALVNRDSAPQAATGTVVAGDREVPALDLDTQSGSPGERVWVRVPDDAGATLEITYDGQTQVVDLADGTLDAGVAAGFSAITPLPVACPSEAAGSSEGLEYEIACTVDDVVAVPYVADLGWAEEGHTWLLVPVRLTPGEVVFTAGSEQAGYRVVDGTGSVSVDGEAGTELQPDEDPTDGLAATYAVPASATGPWELTVEHTWDLTRDGSAPGAPAAEQITYDQTVTFGS